MSNTTIINLPSSEPVVASQFNTQNGNATPLANIIIINGTDSPENNDNGIITKGGVAGTGTQNEVDIVLTNRQTAQVGTPDATPLTILTFALGATPGIFYIRGDIVAFDVTDSAGAAYDFTIGARTDGATATIIATSTKDIFEEAAMAAADFSISASANNIVIQVTGILGKNIDWNCVITYRFIG